MNEIVPHEEIEYVFRGPGPVTGQPFFTGCQRCEVRQLAVRGTWLHLRGSCRRIR
jgi:hypothetical protein